jgi:hypothetical protein
MLLERVKIRLRDQEVDIFTHDPKKDPDVLEDKHLFTLTAKAE